MISLAFSSIDRYALLPSPLLPWLRLTPLPFSSPFASLLRLWWLWIVLTGLAGGVPRLGPLLWSGCDSTDPCIFLWLFFSCYVNLVCFVRFCSHSCSCNSREAARNRRILNKRRFHKSDKLNNFSGTKVHHWHGTRLLLEGKAHLLISRKMLTKNLDKGLMRLIRCW